MWHLLTWHVLAQGRGSLTCSQVPGWATNHCPGAAVWGCASCCGGAAVKQIGCDPGDPEWTTSGCLTASSTCCSPRPSARSCASLTVVTDKSSPSRNNLVSSMLLLKQVFSTLILVALRLPLLYVLNPRTLPDSVLKHDVWMLQVIMRQIASTSSEFL